MSQPIDERLAKLGVTLPGAPTPAANYLPYVISGKQLLIAGQAAVVDGRHKFVGRFGAEFNVADGKAAAWLAAIKVLAQVKAACYGNRLARCLRICGYLKAAGCCGSSASAGWCFRFSGSSVR